jgi:hypothetical protein
MGEMLIIWSARLVVGLYLARMAMDVLLPNDQRRDRLTRIVWTAALAVYLLHVAFAYQFVHGWSHAAAQAHTAKRTWETTGVNWGGGIFINDAFTLLWIADVAWWWRRSLRNEPAPRWAYWTVQAIFAVMFVNATVVFGPPFWRWLGPAAAAGLVAAAMLNRRRGAPPAYEPLGSR